MPQYIGRRSHTQYREPASREHHLDAQRILQNSVSYNARSLLLPSMKLEDVLGGGHRQALTQTDVLAHQTW